MRRQYHNYSSSELFLFFHLPFIFPPGGGHMVHCLCVCACWDVLVCMCTWEGASIAQKIPLRGICIGLLCYSKLSGTLVPTYLSMSVQMAENKLICFFFSPLLSVSAFLFFTCSLPSVQLYISSFIISFLFFSYSAARYFIFLQAPFCLSFSPLHTMKACTDKLSVYLGFSLELNLGYNGLSLDSAKTLHLRSQIFLWFFF